MSRKVSSPKYDRTPNPFELQRTSKMTDIILKTIVLVSGNLKTNALTPPIWFINHLLVTYICKMTFLCPKISHSL